MKIAFVLTMPSNNSWNGKWSGEGDLYALVLTVTPKKGSELLALGSCYYNFGDGWAARVTMSAPDRREQARIRKQSRGFCGYKWMIDSILDHGEIRP